MRRATIALLAGALLVIPGAAVGEPSDGSVPNQEPSYPLVDSNGNHISDGLEAGIEDAAPSDTFDVIATFVDEAAAGNSQRTLPEQAVRRRFTLIFGVFRRPQ